MHAYCGSVVEDGERQRSKLDAANSEEYLLKIFHFGFAGSQLQHVGSGSLTRDRTQSPYIGNMESQTLDHQGSPVESHFKRQYTNGLLES